MFIKSFRQKVGTSKIFKKNLLPLVADPELVAGRGRIKVGVNPQLPSPPHPNRSAELTAEALSPRGEGIKDVIHLRVKPGT